MAKITPRASNDSDWFSRGEEAAAQARQAAVSAFRPEFWIKDGESAELIFLDRESFNIHVHQLRMRGRVRKYTCRRRGCPLCKVDTPRFVAVYRVIDLREFPTRDGKKRTEYKQKYFEAGARLQPAIAKLMDKDLLYKKVCEVSRTGGGTQTTYQVIPIGPIDEAFRAILKKQDLMKNHLDIETDYAPRPSDDLESLVEMFGDADERDDAPPARGRAAAPPARRSYFEDVDDIPAGDDGDDEPPFSTEDDDE